MKKITAIIMVLATVMLITACSSNKEGELTVPEDFSFSLTWNCNGDSTYDSATGKLVKQKIATNLEDYTTTYLLTNEQKLEIYRLIVEMDPQSYPDEYNPMKYESAPSRDIVFSVTYNGITKTITCRNVSLGNDTDGEKGRRFMAVHDAVVKCVTDSSEWAALPEYEFHYE